MVMDGMGGQGGQREKEAPSPALKEPQSRRSDISVKSQHVARQAAWELITRLGGGGRRASWRR